MTNKLLILATNPNTVLAEWRNMHRHAEYLTKEVVELYRLKIKRLHKGLLKLKRTWLNQVKLKSQL
jgi:hypothetical protein